MEETLKLILEKLNQMDSKMTQMDSRISEIDAKLDSKADKDDIIHIENTLGEKVKALFDDREVKNDCLHRIEEKINVMQDEISTIRKVTLKNSADIIDLQNYRLEN